MRTLGELVRERGGSLKTGPFGTTLKASEYSKLGGVPLVSVGEVGNGTLRLSRSTPLVGPEVVRRLPEYVLRDGDIVFGRKGAVDRCGLVRPHEDGYFLGSDGIRLRLGEGIDARFMAYQLQSSRVRSWLLQNASGTTMASLNQEILGRVPVRVPPPAEQKYVGEAMSAADDQISTLERLIAKKQAIKQGMMQELLTGRTRLPDFTGEWQDARLGSLGTFLKGRSVKRDDVRSTGVACIRYGEIYTAFGDYTDETRSFVTSDVASTALPIRRGDVLFAGSGETKAEIGMSLAYTGYRDAVAGGDIIVLRGAGFDPVFLASLLNSPAVAVQKARKGQGDAVVHINSRALADVELRLPDFEEQEAIAAVIKDADAEISALVARLTKARAIKQGMMQQLLTGRVRLAVGKGAA